MADHGHDIVTRSSRPRAIAPGARCIDCRYPLVGLGDDICPECGRGFDPADPRTFLGELPRWLRSGNLNLAPWWMRLVLLVVILATAADAYFMGLEDTVTLAIACVSMPTLGVACIRAACGRIALVELQQPSEVIKAMMWRRIRLPLIAAALTGLLGLHVGAWARLAVSLPWIAPAARAVAAAGPGTCDGQSRQLGLFRVTSINYCSVDEWNGVGLPGATVYVRLNGRLHEILCDGAGVPIGWFRW